jgi:CspA family cold shock protein
MKGVVRTITAEKGYGFIRTPDGVDYFFHKTDYTGFWDDLVNDGMVEVEFDPAKTPKGPRASNVTRISEMKA